MQMILTVPKKQAKKSPNKSVLLIQKKQFEVR